MTTGLAGQLQGFFHVYMREQRALSPNTIKSYRDSLKLLIAYVGTGQRSVRQLSAKAFDPLTVMAFLQNLEDPEQGRGNCAQSRNQRLAAIQSFFKYLVLHHPALEGQAKRIFAIPMKRHPPRMTGSLTRKELEAVLEQPSTDTSDGLRDLAILIFMYNTGARAQEAADTRISWFDFLERTVSITGKGQKQRLTPLWPATVRVLKIYLEKHRRKPQPTAFDRFFINQRGGAFTRFGMRSLFKKYLKLATRQCPELAERRLSTHSMRHTTAVHLLASKVGPHVIKAWLGHASISSTSRYLDTDLNQKRRILEQFGPPSNLESILDPKPEAESVDLVSWLDHLNL